MKTILPLLFLLSSCTQFVSWVQKEKGPQVSPPAIEATAAVTATPEPTPPEPQIDKTKVLDEYCAKINERFKRYGWFDIICNSKRWTFERLSPEGNPLIFQAFNSKVTNATTTLFMCTVHGDELVTAYMCVRLVKDILFDNPEKYENANIVIAPIVNPDGFLAKTQTRTNSNGIDLNRNFPTKDWEEHALSSWQRVKKKDRQRRFPGDKANSEIETQFQIWLLETFKPDKVVSIHSPYGFLDFDVTANTLNQHFIYVSQETKALAYNMGKQSRNFPVVDFKFFPGSLGNYAGNERGIPTFTIELSDNRPENASNYWRTFKSALKAVAEFRYTTKSE